MRIEKDLIVPLGYGKFFRSDSIIGMQPIEENRGPGRRTRVYVDSVPEAIVASRSENAILHDLVGEPTEEMKAQQLRQLLGDVLTSIEEIPPMMRTFIRDQAHWDLDRLLERLKDTLGESES